MKLALSLILLTYAVATASETGSSKSWHNGYEHGYKMVSSGAMEMHYSSNNKHAQGSKPKKNYAYSFGYDQWDDDGKVKTVSHVVRSGHMPYGAGNYVPHDGHIIAAAVHDDHVPFGVGSQFKSNDNINVATTHSSHNPNIYTSNLGFHDNTLGLTHMNSHVSHAGYDPYDVYSKNSNGLNSFAQVSIPDFGTLVSTGNSGHLASVKAISHVTPSEIHSTGIHPFSNMEMNFGISGYGNVGHTIPVSHNKVKFVNHGTQNSFRMRGADNWLDSTNSAKHVMHAGYHPGVFGTSMGGNHFGNLGFDAFCDTFGGDSLFGSLF